MESRNHSTFSDWLSQQADGSLPPIDRVELDAHVETCAACQHERADYEALTRMLEGAHLPVRPDFKDRVMSALPPTGWEARQGQSWAIPAFLVVALGILASVLLGHGPVGTASSAALAIAQMVGTAATAGAGLLHASWKGIGLVVQDGLSSRLAMGVFGFLVLSVNLLLISLVRRRVSSPASVSPRSGHGG
jgi:anti-sigma factor RsiW